MIKRMRLIVYTNNLRSLHLTHHIGHLQYYSRRFHYAIIYVNADKVYRIQQQLLQKPQVKKVELSPQITSFEQFTTLKKHSKTLGD